MTDQELIFRMFICQFMGWYPLDTIIIGFDTEGSLANRILPLFPRKNEDEQH
jgi:hypothetical protein